jgi:hypothetical protein
MGVSEVEEKFEYSSEVYMEKMQKGPAKLDLTTVDGNAYSIMGAVRQAMRKAGYSQQAQKEYQEDSMSGDYDHLLQVAIAWVEEPDECDDEDEEDY